MITLAPEFVDANPGLEHILSNIDFIDAGWRQIVRDDFGYFRQHIRPGMLWGFWNEVVATESSSSTTTSSMVSARRSSSARRRSMASRGPRSTSSAGCRAATPI